MYSSIRNILARIFLSISQFFNSKYSGQIIIVYLSILSILQFQIFWQEYSCQFVNSSIPIILARIFLSICQFFNSKHSGQNIFVNLTNFKEAKAKPQPLYLNLTNGEGEAVAIQLILKIMAKAKP